MYNAWSARVCRNSKPNDCIMRYCDGMPGSSQGLFGSGEALVQTALRFEVDFGFFSGDVDGMSMQRVRCEQWPNYERRGRKQVEESIAD